MDNESMLLWMERKQNLLLRIRAAITLDRMDIVKELSYELQAVLEKESSLKISIKYFFHQMEK